MSETMTQPPPAEVTPKKHTKKWIWIGGAVTVTLALVGAVAVPAVVHDQRVTEYVELVDATNELLVQQASLETEAAAWPGFLEQQEAAAREIVAQVTALGTEAAPIFTPEVSEKLAKVAGAESKKLGEVQELGEEGARLLEQLTKKRTEYIDAVAAAKSATDALEAAPKDAKDRTKLEQASKDADAQVKALSSWNVVPAELTLAQTVELLGVQVTKKSVKALPANEVTTEVLTDAQKAHQKTSKQVGERVGQNAEFSDAQVLSQVLASVEPVLDDAASTTPEQATLVNAAAPRADQAALDSVTKAAKDAAGSKSASVPEKVRLLAAYVTAAKAAQSSHVAVLAAEALAAAEAAGASGYTDPSTGEWAATPGWSDGGDWSGGGSSSGSSSGGGSNSGGSNSGGSNSGGSSGGGTPESWFIANCQWGYSWSSGSGGTGFCYPAPDLDDDW